MSPLEVLFRDKHHQESRALALLLGIGLHRFPDGTAVTMPLRTDDMLRRSWFRFGQLLSVDEPVDAAIVTDITPSVAILPYALSFAVDMLIFVVVEELIPKSQRDGNTDLATLALTIGFTILMFLMSCSARKVEW